MNVFFRPPKGKNYRQRIICQIIVAAYWINGGKHNNK